MSLNQQFTQRLNAIANADFQVIHGRLAALLEWMDLQPPIKKILDEIRVTGRGKELVSKAHLHTPPQAHTLEDVAAVGLEIMQDCKEDELWRIAMAWGIQDYNAGGYLPPHGDKALREYVLPLLTYVIERIPAEDTPPRAFERDLPFRSEKPETNMSKLIFVSHSHHDKDLANALLEFLGSAFHLRPADFVCASVDGSKLRGGDDTDNVLRREIRETKAFLSLLTPTAVTSTYVLFELGARWGTEKSHIPLLAKGAGTHVLKEPLKATNALHLSDESEVLQLVHDLQPVLGLAPEPANIYVNKARKVVELSIAGEVEEIRRVASSRLNQCVDIMKSAGDLNSGLSEIRGVQRSWEQSREEVVIVADDRFVWHRHPSILNQPASSGWPDQMAHGQSAYPLMKAERRGNRVVQIVGHGKRHTALAHEQLENPKCIIVAEAHYTPK